MALSIDRTCICCGICMSVCSENAILEDDLENTFLIQQDLCTECKACIEVCPVGSIQMHS
ncbi:4Fe-4S binding protein [bacterium]|nr:4Fe-4S binding protein [candidate division CSSED10-310 bacterium]